MNRTGKRVFVAGLGGFGREVALALARQCDVLAVDQDQARVDEISEQVQSALVLDARDFGALSSVVSPDFDEAIVGIGDNMEASILATLHLKNIGVRRIRAKATSDDHASILRSIGATEVIFPEREAADRLAARILNPNLLDFIPLAEGFMVIDMIAPPSFHGQSLADLALRSRFGAFVIAMKSPDARRVEFLPGPNHKVEPGDVLVVIGRGQGLLKLQAMHAG